MCMCLQEGCEEDESRLIYCIRSLWSRSRSQSRPLGLYGVPHSLGAARPNHRSTPQLHDYVTLTPCRAQMIMAAGAKMRAAPEVQPGQRHSPSRGRERCCYRGRGRLGHHHGCSNASPTPSRGGLRPSLSSAVYIVREVGFARDGDARASATSTHSPHIDQYVEPQSERSARALRGDDWPQQVPALP